MDDPPAAEPAAPPPAPRIFGPYVERIRQALERAQSLFLSGPTATGKTFQATEVAHQLGLGVELVVFDPGTDARDLFGGYARSVAARPRSSAPVAAIHPASDEERSSTAIRPPRWLTALEQDLKATKQALAELRHRLEDRDVSSTASLVGDWLPVDGPVTRWARRAIAGERVLLLLDELPRGHKSCIAAIMRVLNVYDQRTVAAQGLQLPSGLSGTEQFHIIDVWMTRERLVVPADRVKIVATGNLGDDYEGLALNDPAFRRRWGAWLHLASYQPEVQAQILADRLELPPAAALIAAMRAVAKAVEQFQHDEEKLLTVLDLATLIAWGAAAIHLVQRQGRSASAAFIDAATDVWLERVCPTKGAELDPDVLARLLRILHEAAPGSLR